MKICTLTNFNDLQLYLSRDGVPVSNISSGTFGVEFFLSCLGLSIIWLSLVERKI